jgi:hypothetical protein
LGVEINIMEMGAGSAIAEGVVDQRVVSGAHWEVNETYTTSAGFLDASDSLVSTSTYHIFKLDWTPTTLTTYLDDVEIWTLNIDRTTCLDCEEFHKPHFMVLNLAVGGGFTSGTCGTSSSASSSSAGICEPLRTADDITASLPATIAIDWVRIYDNGHTILTTVPFPPAEPTAPTSATPDALTDAPASTEPSTLEPVQGDGSGSGGGGSDFIGGGGGGGSSGKGSKASKSSKSSKSSRSSSTESVLQFESRGRRRHTRGASAAAVITAYGIAQLVG